MGRRKKRDVGTTEDETSSDLDNSAIGEAADQSEVEKTSEVDSRSNDQEPEPSTDSKDQSSLTDSSPKPIVETKMTTTQPTVLKWDIVNMTPQPIRVKYYEVIDKKSVGKVYKVPAGGTSVHGQYPPVLLRARHFKALEGKKLLRLRRSR